MSSSGSPVPVVDPRGQRFAASVTSVVLAVVLVLQSPWLLALQAVVFALAVVLGPGRSPYGLVFAKLIRPRLGPPEHPEDARPPRFAQGVGLVFSLVGLVGYFSGLTLLGAVATGLALAAALLNAVIGFCLGCELYLLLKRLTPARS
ncbi:DUF4395 domain-containing protein [Microlunatus panaciterrae]|uniref:DUF4395 domain-containing protein n=1 Tax=Microlunatus panaciterrae TaxID=400768 RepID=A0ABS2RJB3_9ACTN|nr:DUF4395 domain-containing protein [Microlunatus panaciterrae]MBM7798657.1 hypothetical protein [Microlunatus panaciterrae]